MQFSWSGQRDERRRRVIIDEQASSSQAEGGETARPRAVAAGSPMRNYGPDALAERQARITDLLALRPWTLSVLTLTALTLIAALELLHGQSGSWARVIGRNELSALDLAAPGSLSSWFSSLLLTTAACGAGLIYALRRHRIDDYRGRYRLWLWVAAALLLSSIDATTALHASVGGLLVHLSGTTWYGNANPWWILGYALLLGGLILRLAGEIRSSRGATASLVMAAGAYVAVIAIKLHWLPVPAGALCVMAEAGGAMLGHLGVLLGIALYGRHVYLDAQGKLPLRTPRPRKSRSQPESSSADGQAASDVPAKTLRSTKRVRLDPAHDSQDSRRARTDLDVNQGSGAEQDPASLKRTSTSPRGTQPQQVAANVSAAKRASVEEFDEDEEGMSKAERRRLRKKSRRE